ncbi:MAG: OsmC family peroxiredoxin [Streptosporangiales bacterium]|nr:OsmC family peroxiredoxin [Streptosporangiales bacterium]
MSVPADRRRLRERQRPLKDRYGAEPGAAVLRLRAEGSLAQTGVTCSVDTGRALVEAGLHAAAGGDGSSACSGDLLLQALVACAGVTLRAVAVNRGLDVTGTVRAEGELDLRGTLGVDRDVPVGFRTILLHFDLHSDAPAEDLAALVATSEAYCVVLQTLAGGTRLRVTHDAT